ncbi:MAG: hypothetical protein RQ801_06785 [Spirochaetaceae bacterium]|nr:hypothetical protein [Spirochaetaceae bacterium]MDT8297986.1 hypothetical protein [Spirochaetaceae bacterium]
MPRRKPSRQTINIIIAVLTVIIVAAIVLSRDRGEGYPIFRLPFNSYDIIDSG